MTLGRPFKAGTTSNSTIASRQRRLNHDASSTVATRRNGLFGNWEQALKGLPKVNRRYATKSKVTCFASATLESTPQVTLIVFNSVLIQEFQVLLLERFLAMMFALVLNVTNHVR